MVADEFDAGLTELRKELHELAKAAGNADGEPPEGHGEAADAMVRVTAVAGRISAVELNSRVMRLASQELAEAFAEAANAALVDLESKYPRTDYPSRRPRHAGDPVGGRPATGTCPDAPVRPVNQRRAPTERPVGAAMGGFQITPDALRKSATGLVDVVDRLGTALNQLESTLHGHGSPWGTGLFGPIIGELYEGVHELAMGSLETNTEVMSEYAEGLDTMADDIQELEGQIKEGFEFFQESLAADFPVTGP